MSNTQYARPHLLRIDGQEKDALARSVMAEIAHCSPVVNGTDAEKQYLRTLRGLLERLTD